MEEPTQPPQIPQPDISRAPSTTAPSFTSPTPTIWEDPKLYASEVDPKADSKEPRAQYKGHKEENEQQEIPYHVFGRHTKLTLVLIVSATASLSGLSSNIYFPAMEEVSNVSLLLTSCRFILAR